MIIKSLNINKLFYTNTEEMPMNKFNEFMNHMILDNCVGGEYKDVTDHLKKIYAFVAKNKKDHAEKQIHNLYQCLHNVKSGNNPKKEALTFLLKEDIDLNKVSYKAIIKAYNELKKKFLTNLR